MASTPHGSTVESIANAVCFFASTAGLEKANPDAANSSASLHRMGDEEVAPIVKLWGTGFLWAGKISSSKTWLIFPLQVEFLQPRGEFFKKTQCWGIVILTLSGGLMMRVN